MGWVQFSHLREKTQSCPRSFWSLWIWSSEALGDFFGLSYLLWSTSGTSNFKNPWLALRATPFFRKFWQNAAPKSYLEFPLSVNVWSCGLRHPSPSSRVTAGTAMLALPLLWENQSSGSCTGLYIRCCLFCCQLYRNPLPKPCNCRMFCYPIPPASYYLLRLSRVTSPGLIVITDKAWGEEFCLSSAGRD